MIDINLEDISVIFFDLDDTLYNRSIPFLKTFEAYIVQRVLHEDSIQIGCTSDAYNMITNDWKELANRAYQACTQRGDEVFLPSQRGEITMQEMYIYRFTKGFSDTGINISENQALEYQNLYSKMLMELELDSDMRMVLDNSRSKGIPMGIITNGPAKHQRDKIHVLDLEQWISQELIFISGECGYDKPDLRIFQLAQQAAGCEPSEILLIGDSVKNDIEPAQHMGWQTKWIQRKV